ncbi:ribokinase [Singulisphaera sp. GP187]|uniref:PfkB family carbohydrate kinase n=1 Tax=Singulisphaera sp. GP187 TaxID=1882752 RepID=UPI0009265EAB|nr:PfkB family carbohydrate kinase [Singulisphaera sp. GP187]SIO61061.1 ribokinase [Singulisphaera sp. GP187]
MTRRTLVFGPAYLDRILRVNQPLLASDGGGPLDQSVDGRLRFGPGLTLVDPDGGLMELELPADWPGPTGRVELWRTVAPPGSSLRRTVRGISWSDELGGMGAGFAAALGGDLVSALGAEADRTSQVVATQLLRHGIPHHPIRFPEHPADWTLLITSGKFGDKLPIGFRGCHAALTSLAPWVDQSCALRVVAGLPNRIAAQALRAPGAGVRVFAPAMRNIIDRDCPISRFAEAVDVLSCNRHEWEQLADREEVAWKLSVLAITEGADGCVIRFTNPVGEAISLRVPAFPRSRPPRDTNRAGEAFASTLVASLLDGGWEPGVTEESLIRAAAERASAAAALVLDRLEFGFPTPREIDAALVVGRVP